VRKILVDIAGNITFAWKRSEILQENIAAGFTKQEFFGIMIDSKI
jgi:hypothetical protein